MVETPKTIMLKGKQWSMHDEGVAAAAITPGYLVYRDTTDKIAKHATAAGNVVPMFALENDIFGKGIDDAYAANDQVICVYPCRGANVYAKVAASAAAIVIGDYVESAGDGTVRKHTPQAVAEGGAASYSIFTNQIVGRAVEAVDNSGGGTEARLRIEIV